jgi:hypothetical protein
LHRLEGDSHVGEDLARDSILRLGQGQQDVLGADVVVTEAQRVVQGPLEYLLGAGSEPTADYCPGAGSNQGLDLSAHLVVLYVDRHVIPWGCRHVFPSSGVNVLVDGASLVLVGVEKGF